ncbi:succinyldiaminopimelate transaminase [Paraoerskovia marina]|uniref:Aminotransferase n=1 Tax=Paraoerskovia marina TaxID=545619 RepID=A0A1H1UNQ7_9CELL|nr:succinyldiaminopimelate transaminase [Paraoerskovia marina]SDS74093.1 succinyldiaminopimelate transaminase [Paraoerskovia marina]
MGFADLSGLPYPWDTIGPYVDRARSHPDGIVDLSIGTPVDPTPDVVRDALAGAGDAHGYPTTHGTPALRDAIAAWFARRRGVAIDADDVLPTVGSKELVGLLPSLLRLGAGDVVVHPDVAYPTYDVGARLAGATPLPVAGVEDWAGRADVRLVWVNSPSNPTGAVADVETLRRTVEAAREIGAVVVSDECYAELPWAERWVADGVPSLLDPRVCGGSHAGLLVAYSLSKQSSVAGYRAAFVAGDQDLVRDLLATRKHLGMIVPGPVQAAMTAALADDEHVAAQRRTYGRRRERLLDAVLGAGYVVEHSEAGLYLWVRAADGVQKDCWDLVGEWADRGILVGPGEFYGAAGARHVRVSLTASDERVDAACDRLRTAPR